MPIGYSFIIVDEHLIGVFRKVCWYLNHGAQSQWNRDTETPFAIYHGWLWIGYDNPRSLSRKVGRSYYYVQRCLWCLYIFRNLMIFFELLRCLQSTI